MSIGPAYKSFVAGECSPQYANEILEGEIRNILTNCMYWRIHQTGSFYHVGYQRFLQSVRDMVKNRNENHIITDEQEKAVRYFYNRQLIVQMTMHPQSNKNDSTNPFHVSVPLFKAPNYEIQIDILQLSQEQSKANYNMKYFVVIVDTFSRFIWCSPVATLQSKKVQAAFGSALMRPGASVINYESLRNKLKRVVVDGGSEFKSVFPEAVRIYFPNATVITSTPKNRTGNRPTGNGPIEAAIRMLRLVMRDYALGISPNFLGTEIGEQQHGLSKILLSYNSTPQIVLHNKTPIDVGNEAMTLNQEGGDHTNLLKTMKHVNFQRDTKIVLKQHNKTLLGGNQISMNRHGPIGYRIYLPAKQFAKQVDIRVSLKVYVVDKMNTSKPQYVDLVEYGMGTGTLKNVLWNTLVLVKMPVENGPPSILHNFTNTIEEWGFHRPTPQEITRPFAVTRSIIEAIEGEEDQHKRLRHKELIAEPLGHKRRKNAERGARYGGNYNE